MNKELKEKQQQLFELLGKRFLPKKVDDDTVEFVYLSGVAEFNCKMEIDLHSKGIFLSAILSLPILNDFQMGALEWCNAINEKSLIGHFSIDPDSGYVKWSSGFYFWKSELTERIMRTLLESSILNIDNYCHSLLYIFNGGADKDYGKAFSLIGDTLGISVSKSCHYTYETHPSIERT